MLFLILKVDASKDGISRIATKGSESNPGGFNNKHGSILSCQYF
jgi:hypothetical protein